MHEYNFGKQEHNRKNNYFEENQTFEIITRDFRKNALIFQNMTPIHHKRGYNLPQLNTTISYSENFDRNMVASQSFYHPEITP